MFNRITLTLLFAALLSLFGATAFAQDQTGRTYSKADFINIDGGSLQEKIDRAVQSLQQLETIMRGDPENKDKVRGALRAIGARNSPRVVPLLKEIALKDKTLDIQRSAIANLARIPAKESLDALDELFAAADST